MRYLPHICPFSPPSCSTLFSPWQLTGAYRTPNFARCRLGRVADLPRPPVIRTRGLLFVRPEKSWRPIVTISVQDDGHDHGLPHEIVLGSDGQNPNLKSVIQMWVVSSCVVIDSVATAALWYSLVSVSAGEFDLGLFSWLVSLIRAT